MCTTLPVKAKADSVTIGHTMEFGIDLQSNIGVVPRRRDNIGTGPKGLPELCGVQPAPRSPITARLKRARMNAMAAKRF